ncbi:MAG: adenosylmethionine--8-amino-7-oxononanoate transaminase [Candidatus Omnitrophota bacterium]
MDPWIKKDRQYIWHPYTQMKDCARMPPVLIERARGLKLFDRQGNYYYDTISSWWCNVHGHNHPLIQAAIKKQISRLDHVLFAGFTHQPAISLAEQLTALAPRNLTKVFYSDNGSTAVEAALKMSFQSWQNTGKREKKKFVSLDRAYHGDTLGAMSVSGVELFNAVFSPLMFASLKAPAPYCYRCPMGKERHSCRIECIEPLARLLREQHSRIAALILEPLLLAAGGMIIYPAEYLRQAAALCRRYGAHLILDEVATGFGRTARMFACEHAGVQPDFICLSKGLTAGTLPLGATLTTDEIYQAFYDDYERQKTFYHGHTFTANPISCSAALASLEIFARENTLAKVKKLLPGFHRGLERFRGLPAVGDVRYIGLVGAVELVKDKEKKIPFAGTEMAGLKVYREGLKERLILRPLGDVIYLYLPLCVTRDEINIILEKTYKVIRKIFPRI